MEVGSFIGKDRIVFEVGEGYYKVTACDGYSFGLINYMKDYAFLRDNEIKTNIDKLYESYMIAPENFKAQLRIINKIFNDRELFVGEGKTVDTKPSHEKKIQYLKNTFKKFAGKKIDKDAYYELLDPFLKEFNYKQKMIDSRWLHNENIPHHAQRHGDLYIKDNGDETTTVIRDNYINKPKIGKRHFLFNYKQSPGELNNQAQYYKIWDYYENKIPEIFKEIKVSHQKERHHG